MDHTLLKVTLRHECFSRFLNCTNGTKLRNPSRMIIRHTSNKKDFQRRKQFCQWFQEQYCSERFERNIFIGAEVAFFLNWKVNSRNVRHYAPKRHPPGFNYNMTNSRQKNTVWVRLCGRKNIACAYFFEGNI